MHIGNLKNSPISSFHFYKRITKYTIPNINLRWVKFRYFFIKWTIIKLKISYKMLVFCNDALYCLKSYPSFILSICYLIRELYAGFEYKVIVKLPIFLWLKLMFYWLNYIIKVLSQIMAKSISLFCYYLYQVRGQNSLDLFIRKKKLSFNNLNYSHVYYTKM